MKGALAAALIGLLLAGAAASANEPDRSRARRAAEDLAATAINPRTVPAEWLEKARSVAEATRRIELPADLPQLDLPERPVPAPQQPEEAFYLYASAAQGDASLRQAFEIAAGRNMMVIFRGPQENESIPQAIRRLGKLLVGLDPLPRIAIDPERFRQHAVEAAPVLMLERHGQVAARVAGLSDPEFVVDRLARGEEGDLGAAGPVVAVSEPDLFEVIAQRIGALDFAAMRERAIERAWQNVKFHRLPTAAAARERRIDPTIEVTKDIPLPDGTLLVRAGDRINPLARWPFSRRVVVFDATDPRQVRMAKSLADGEGRSGKIVRYLITDLPLDGGGWSDLRALEEALGAPAYVLPPLLADRFGLEAVPAVVEASGLAFVVREVPPPPIAGE